MFKRPFILVLLLLLQSAHSSMDQTDYPWEILSKSIIIDFDPPSGFQAFKVEVIFMEDNAAKVDSIIIDTGSSNYEIDARQFHVRRPLNLNELRPAVIGRKDVYEFASFYLLYGTRTRIECGQEFEWAQSGIKVTVYPDAPPEVEPSNVIFDICEGQTEMLRDHED